MIILIMGVSGSGKSTVGRRLAAQLGWPFIEGDDLHAPDMVRKMSSGTPLSDQDREAWLVRIAALIEELDRGPRSAIIACSALRKTYRQRLAAVSPAVQFVHLKGAYELIHGRMAKRQDHFMQVGLLQSQFETLEEPDHALIVDVTADPEAVVKEIRRSLGL